MNILFVCTGNLCRSPLAAEYLRKILRERKISTIQVSSAGLYTIEGNTAEETAFIVAKENGIDLEKHRSRLLKPEDIQDNDLILVMERMHLEDIITAYPEAEEKVKLLRSFARNGAIKTDIADAYGFPLNTYRQCFKDIKESVEGLFKFLKVHNKI
jgi:protein-tyrosine-phosphatase